MEAQKSLNTLKTRSRLKEVEDARMELEEVYNREQEKYLESKAEEIETAAEHRKSNIVWGIVNEVSGRKGTDSGKIKAKNPQERIQKWKDHFQNLLGQSPEAKPAEIKTVFRDVLPINTDDFTLEELKKCIRSFKNNKASGLDNIPIEVWKTEALDNQLLEVCNRTLNGDRAEIWVKSKILPLPKKGDLSVPENYRGITLTVVAAKIYNKMLLERIRTSLDPLLRINQNGFRPGRSTLAQIVTLRRLLEGVRAKQLKAVVTFVDFKKAFDSIHREKLMSILRAYGVPEKIVRVVNILYRDTLAQILTPDGETDFFKVIAGVLQGDTLAPFLFIIALDYALREATDDETTGFMLEERRSSRKPATYITDADFADDLALLSNDMVQAQTLLTRLEKAAETIGLHINSKKTEYMLINQADSGLKSLGYKQLKKVDDFKYLGSWIANSRKDMDVRIGLAWKSLSKMSKIWKSKIKRDLKLRFFRSTVESVLLYGAESWTLTREMECRLDGTYTKMLRAVLGITWEMKVTNDELYGSLNKLSDVLRVRRLRFIGHMWRRKDELVCKLLMWEPKQGRRKRGRPAMTYIDQLMNDTGLEVQELQNLMDDRKIWRTIVDDVRASSK